MLNLKKIVMNHVLNDPMPMVFSGHVRWRHVVWGVGIQFVMGLAVLRWDVSTYFIDPTIKKKEKCAHV